MITELTLEQEALLPVYRDRWLEIGLSTDRLDRDATRDAIAKLYESRGHKAPSKIVFHEGLVEGKKANFSTSAIWQGQLSAYWVSFYMYMKEVLNIEVDIEPAANLVMNSGLVDFRGDECHVIERPEMIKMDNGLLHNEFGPSIRFRDGFEVYSWRGTRIPKEWITDKGSIDVMTAINWPQVEQRRAAAEIIGWDKVISQLNPVVIDRDDPEIGTLLEVNIPDIGKERFIQVLCGTARQFALPVPPDTKTALAAQAFLHNIPLEEFLLPEIRT